MAVDVIMIYFMMIVMVVTCETRIIFSIITIGFEYIYITIIRDHHFHYSHSLCLLLYSLLYLYNIHCDHLLVTHFAYCSHSGVFVSWLLLRQHCLCEIIIILSIMFFFFFVCVILRFLYFLFYSLFSFFFKLFFIIFIINTANEYLLQNL